MVLSLRNRLKLLVYFGAAVLLVVGLFDGGPKVAGITVGRLAMVEVALFVALTAFERYGWRLRPVVWALKSGPVLRGTWKGEVTRADTGQSYEAYLMVRQSFSQAATRLMTAESSSDSMSCQVTNKQEGLTVTEYLYENVPRPTVRSRSPIHYGAVRLESVGQWPTKLEGTYWTDRQTVGELRLTLRSPKLAQNFEDARQLFENTDSRGC